MKDVEEAHQRRIQQDQAVYNDRMDQLTKEKDLANKNAEIVETQFANLKTLHDKLTSDMEMLMKDRESQRKENRTLRTEISSGQAFIDKLQKEKVPHSFYSVLILVLARTVKRAGSVLALT